MTCNLSNAFNSRNFRLQSALCNFLMSKERQRMNKLTTKMIEVICATLSEAFLCNNSDSFT